MSELLYGIIFKLWFLLIVIFRNITIKNNSNAYIPAIAIRSDVTLKKSNTRTI